MPVIFLDIDGVLNRKRLVGSTPRVIDPDLLDHFKLLVRDTGAYVVLASTWRYDAAGIAAAREQGVPFDDLVPDRRPRSRGYEVKEWLRVHQNMGRFAVIDDDDDYGSLPLFQPHPTEGITPEINAAVAAYLSGKTDRDFRRNVLVRALQLVRATLAGHSG